MTASIEMLINLRQKALAAAEIEDPLSWQLVWDARAELARLGLYSEDVERYRTTFAHIHEKQGERDDDSCGKCGLDLRDSVHSTKYRGR